MSARAAARLETLGFGHVHRYQPGKADWFAAGLPREGREAHTPRVADIAQRDVPTCGINDRIGALEFGTLGDLTRMRTCWLLSKHPELSVGEIAEVLGVSVSRVSHALGKLRRHRVVVGRRVARQVLYRLTGMNLGRLVRKEVGAL